MTSKNLIFITCVNKIRECENANWDLPCCFDCELEKLASRTEKSIEYRVRSFGKISVWEKDVNNFCRLHQDI